MCPSPLPCCTQVVGPIVLTLPYYTSPPLLQLTWQDRQAIIYDADDLRVLHSWRFSTLRNEGWLGHHSLECPLLPLCYSYSSLLLTVGWGITHDGSSFIVSDGSEYLFYWDPVTLLVREWIEFCWDPVTLLVRGWIEFYWDPVTLLVRGWIEFYWDPVTLLVRGWKEFFWEPAWASYAGGGAVD